MSVDKSVPGKTQMGYSLPAGLAAIVVLVSTMIFVGTGGGGRAGDTLEGAAPAPRNSADRASAGGWVGSWSASAAAAERYTRDGYADTSIRNVVHTSIGGTAARIELSNLYGTRPLMISHATLALAEAPSSPTAAGGTMRRLTFGTRPSVTIPAGGTVTSDAARLRVPSGADLLVTTYSPSPSGPVTFHPFARQTSYLAPGDRAADPAGTAFTGQSPYWRYLVAVDVWTTEADGAVVVIGDSITDGITSSPGANHRWTDILAERLRTERRAPRYSVLNQGISGNRVLVDAGPAALHNGPSGLRRLERDVISRTGVRTVVIQLGINDILKTPQQRNPELIVGGLRHMVAQAHARGLRVVGATLMPFGGHRGFTPSLEAVRQRVNEQIRAGTVFDAVVDFDAALRDPAHPERLRAAFDSGDHLHPSDNGYRAMAQAVDLSALQGARPAKL